MFNFQVKNDVQARLNQSANTSSKSRPAVYTVKNGDTVSGIAEKYGMTVEQFMQWTKLKNTSLQIGQEIELKQATVPKGKGIRTLCNDYNMDFNAFCKLNKIHKDYQAKAEEQFYVFEGFGKNKTSTEKTAPVKPETTAPTSSEVKYKVKSGETVELIANKFNTTQEHIKKLAGIKNPRQLRAGQKLALPSIKVERGMTVDGIRKEYNMSWDQFKALNPHIKSPNELSIGQIVYVPVKPFEKKSETSANSTNIAQSTGTVVESGGSSDKNPKVTLNNGKTFKASELRKDAINSAKNDRAFDGYDKKKVYVNRPLPHIVNGKIEASCELQNPINKSKDESLKGKVVIINPGHGGYNQDQGFFDPGTILATKDSKGNVKALEEWNVNKAFADTLAFQLRDKGATVIIVQGAVKNGGMAKQKYLESLLKGEKGPQEVRDKIKATAQKDMLFISLHVESVKETPNDKRCSVIYGKYKNEKKVTVEDAGDKNLANTIKNEIKEGFFEYTPEVESRNLYVLRAIGSDVPGVLIELGNIANSRIQNSLLSSNDQGKYMQCVTNAIIKTLNPEAAEDDTQ